MMAVASFLLLPFVTIVLAFFIMLTGACVDRHFEINANGKALCYAGAGVVFGLAIFAMGMAGQWLATRLS